MSCFFLQIEKEKEQRVAHQRIALLRLERGEEEAKMREEDHYARVAGHIFLLCDEHEGSHEKEEGGRGRGRCDIVTVDHLEALSYGYWEEHLMVCTRIGVEAGESGKMTHHNLIHVTLQDLVI